MFWCMQIYLFVQRILGDIIQGSFANSKKLQCMKGCPIVKSITWNWIEGEFFIFLGLSCSFTAYCIFIPCCRKRRITPFDWMTCLHASIFGSALLSRWHFMGIDFLFMFVFINRLLFIPPCWHRIMHLVVCVSDV